MKAPTLLFLRISVALLVLIWGLDKIVNPAHSLAVSDRFYLGLLSFESLLPVLGVAQILLAIMAGAGWKRKWVDPAIALINLGSLLGVWRSIIDPWGWVLEGTNALFFPSLIVFAACLVLIAFRDEERWALDEFRRTR